MFRVVSRNSATWASVGMSAIRGGEAVERDTELAREHLCLKRIDARSRRRRNTLRKRRIEHKHHDVCRFAKLNDAWLERSRFELFGDRQKGERQVDDHASERNVWRDAILIGVRSNHE